eukprot:SAG11_NODE_12943_length_677_cov_33.148789_1_plen_225_part_11
MRLSFIKLINKVMPPTPTSPSPPAHSNSHTDGPFCMSWVAMVGRTMTRSQGKAPAFSKTLGGLDKMLKPSKLKLKAKAKAKVEVAGVAAAAAVEAAKDHVEAAKDQFSMQVEEEVEVEVKPPQDVVDAHEVEPALSPKSPQEDAVMSQEGLFERPDLFSDFAHPSQKKALKKCDERMEKSTKAVWKQQFKGDKMIAEALIETVVSDDPWNYDLHPTAKDLKQCFV